MGHIKKIQQNSPLFFILLTISINMIGFSMVFPMLPFYAQSFQATPFVIGLLAASHALANFISAPVLGRVSDRYGRRPVLIAGLFATIFSFSLMGLANSLWMLFIGRVIQGIVSSAILPTARAYMGDMTTGGERVAAMGKLGAAMSFGLLIGPAFSSFLIGLSTIHTPFFVAAFISLINALLVIFFLPESVKEKVHNLVIREGFLNVYKVFTHLKGEQKLLFIILFVWSFALSNNQLTFPLLESAKFNLGAEHIGYFFTALAVVSITIQGFLLPKIIALIGEKNTLVAGMLIMGGALCLIPLAPTVILTAVAFMGMGMGSNLNRPVAEGIISRTTDTGQGTTMGVAQSFESLGRVVGPASAGVFFGISSSMPFFISAFIITILGIWVLKTLQIRTIKTADIFN